jgi:hypothetical protein
MAGARNDTIWQQGFALNKVSAAQLALVHPVAKDDTVVVLISHDCDLLEDSSIEPYCEVIVGRSIAKADGNFTGAKNPRRLHLIFSAGATLIAAEFLATDKRLIEKSTFLSHAPLEDVRLTTEEHFTLQSWLSARYHRPIFPDEFDRRFKEKPAEVHKKVINIIKGTGADLIAVRFDVDDGKNVERSDTDDPYLLGIFLIYNVSQDPGKAEKTAIAAASNIRSIFRQQYFIGERWQKIQLRECVSISEDALSVHQLRCLKPWHFDYLNIIADERGEASPSTNASRPLS